MTNEGTSPPVSAELVAWLERLFPLRPTPIDARHREIWFASGQQSILTKLRAEFVRQTTPQDDED